MLRGTMLGIDDSISHDQCVSDAQASSAPAERATSATEGTYRTVVVHGEPVASMTELEALDAVLEVIRRHGGFGGPVFTLLRQGWSSERVAEESGLAVDQVRIVERAYAVYTARAEFLAAYYVQHPDRIPNRWYPVIDEQDPPTSTL